MLELCSFQSNEVFISVGSSSKALPSSRHMEHAPDMFGLAGQSKCRETNPDEILIKALVGLVTKSGNQLLQFLLTQSVCAVPCLLLPRTNPV